MAKALLTLLMGRMVFMGMEHFQGRQLLSERFASLLKRVNSIRKEFAPHGKQILSSENRRLFRKGYLCRKANRREVINFVSHVQKSGKCIQ